MRADLVGDTKDYRWCGYAEAVAGKGASRLAYPVVISAVAGQSVEVGKAIEEYRVWLYGPGHLWTKDSAEKPRSGDSAERRQLSGFGPIMRRSAETPLRPQGDEIV